MTTQANAILSSSQNGSIVVGSTNKPTHIGRVLDDGSTQLYTYEYNGFGNITKTIDPVGRTFSYIYATTASICWKSGRPGRAKRIAFPDDLQRPAPASDLHRRCRSDDHLHLQCSRAGFNRNECAGSTQPPTVTTPTVTARRSIGPLGDTTTWTYDAMGRVRTNTDVSGYTLTFDYDDLIASRRSLFRIRPSTSSPTPVLDRTLIRDRAGRQTSFEYNSVRQMTKRTDPLNRVTLFQWCKCGALKTLTDPMGRTTTWRHDIRAASSARSMRMARRSPTSTKTPPAV